MISFIKTKDSTRGEADLAAALVGALKLGKRTIWTLPGGSNVPIAVAVLKKVRSQVTQAELKNLVIMQIDERYGAVGHKDSNWQQLLDLGFPISGIEVRPILNGRSLDDTAKDYGKIVQKEFNKASVIIGQFGMGSDGHIAGLMPRSAGFDSALPVVGYEHPNTFTRLSVTVPWLLKIAEAYVFVFGSSKKEAIEKLRSSDPSMEQLPAVIFKSLPKVNFYTDQI